MSVASWTSVATVDPLKIGSAPVPYAPNVIGFPALPLLGTVNCSRHVQPRLKRMLSPGEKDEALTLATVFQATSTACDVPAPASPLAAQST
jgi:hypothetical protein